MAQQNFFPMLLVSKFFILSGALGYVPCKRVPTLAKSRLVAWSAIKVSAPAVRPPKPLCRCSSFQRAMRENCCSVPEVLRKIEGLLVERLKCQAGRRWAFGL